MVDGKIVSEEPETAFRAGRQAKVPYMIGANAGELGFFPLSPAMVDGMLARFGAAREEVVAAYDPGKTGNLGEVGVGLMSDEAMVEPARLLARLASASGQPTYAYRFSHVATSIRKEVAGAQQRVLVAHPEAFPLTVDAAWPLDGPVNADRMRTERVRHDERRQS